jgi:cytidine deaminase
MNKKEIKSYFIEYNSTDELPKEDALLIEKAKKAAKKAYAPYSKFSVGAALLLDNGEIIEGNNQENAAYPSGLCAERVAIFYANSVYPNNAIKAIAITALTEKGYISESVPPCGACLQVMRESEKRAQNTIRVILFGEKNITVAENIQQFLPMTFNKEMLE